MRIYDVTVPLSEFTPVWPGTPRFKMQRVSTIAAGDQLNQSHLSMGSHVGTHVDAPFHFVTQGLTVDRLDIELLMGPAFVAEVDELENNTIDVYDLASIHFPRQTTRLLLKTSNSHFWEDRLTEFERDFVHLSPKAASWLVKRGIKLVGVDYLSVDSFRKNGHRVHQTLLQAGVVIVEGLNLSRVPAGRCQLICLPLKIEKGDAAPARVLVIRD